MKKKSAAQPAERVERHELDALVQAHDRLADAQREPLAALNAIQAMVFGKYGLQDGDQIDKATGTIMRRKAE